jgi:hypothetical protein
MIEVITDNALAKLNELSQSAVLIRGAICYWTYPAVKLEPAFHRALAHPEGSICVDIHSPTSISTLLDFHQRGAHVFLHLFQLVGHTEVTDSKGVPDQLMHSKVLMFEDHSDECAIWVGSHNGTARAILGINFECSVVIRCPKSSDIYLAVKAHLDAIKRRSTPFDPQDVDHYRLLQGLSNADGFIEAVDHHEASIPSGTEVSFFGVDTQDYALLRSVGKRVYLAISSTKTGVETIYETDIKQTGVMDAVGAPTITFGARRYAFRATPTIPVLERHQMIRADVYDAAKFFVTLRVGNAIPGAFAIEAPPNPWRDTSLDAYLEGRSAAGAPRRQESSELPSGKRIRIQQAGSPGEPSIYPDLDQLEWERAYTVLPLAARAQLPNHRLVRRRILKRPKNTPDD